MAEHTALPWKVFTTPDGRKLVGVGGEDGEGILDCGFGVWAWDDAAGIANANLVVTAVNNHDAMVKVLTKARARIEYLGGFGHERHAKANEKDFFPEIDTLLASVGGSGHD